MPPTMGAAIGFITSDPMPVLHRIGTRPAITTLTVMSFGLSRSTDPAIDVAADIARRRIDVDIPGQLTVLVAYHGGSRRQRDAGELRERNLRAHRRLHQHPLQVRQRVAEPALVPDVDRIALAPFDRAR